MAEQRMPQVSRQVAEANAAVRMRLPFADTADFDDARRGLVGTLSDAVIRGTDGRVVWDADAYEFLDDECPESVNPSLWRQGQLNAIHGLFEVTPGIYLMKSISSYFGSGQMSSATIFSSLSPTSRTFAIASSCESRA